jgi:hypothetical protein
MPLSPARKPVPFIIFRDRRGPFLLAAYRILLALLIATGLVAPCAATEILSVEVTVNGDIYHLHGESIIEAPPEFIFSVLMDYDNFHRIASGIAETRFLESGDDDRLLGYTRIDSCVLFFCRDFEKVERIESSAPETILTETLPEQSDFKINNTRWTLKPTEGGTLVIYESDMDPAFWVPPLIGPWVLKNKLAESAETIGIRIEYLLATGQSLSDFSRREMSAAPDK